MNLRPFCSAWIDSGQSADAADRLTAVDGVTYTYAEVGNLLSDGAYSYDPGYALSQLGRQARANLR